MNKHKKILFRRKRDFTALFNDTFNFLRQEFKALFKRLLAILIPVKIGFVLINFILFYDLFIYIYLPDFSYRENPIFILAFWMLSDIAPISITIAVIYDYITNYISNTDCEPVKKSIIKIIRQIFPAIIFGLFIYFLYLFILMYFVGLFKFPFALYFQPVKSILILSGFFLLTPLALIFAIRMFEKLSLIPAVIRSYELIKNQWLSTYASLLLLISMIVLFSYIMDRMHEIFMFIGSSLHLSKTISYIFFVILPSIVNQLIGLLFLSTIIIYLAFRYFDLVERKEAPALADMIEELKGKPVNEEVNKDNVSKGQSEIQ